MCLVAALGGLPLAIELTASYAGRLGLMLATVQQEIEHDGVQAAPFIPSQNKEQRTLVLRFDRSWQALAETPRWQRLFAALSLLEGTSFPRDAELALATAAAKRGNASDASASPAGDLAALVDYALVESLGGERFRLHPLLRDYAAHRFATLESALQEQLGEAMLAFWLKYALAHPGFEGMSALEAEAAGLIGTLAWAHNHARYRELLVLTDAIHEAWWVRGRREEELRIYTWAVQAANMLGDLERQRWATHLQAETQRRMGRVEEARAGYERALEIARQMKRLKDERSELHGLAVLDRLAGRLEEARAGYERALAIARHLHDKTAEQREVYALAMLDDTMGRMVEAGGAYMEALEIARQLGDQPAEAGTLRLFGLFLCKHGQVVQGRMMIEHSLEINERLSAIYYIGKCHEFLGWVDVQVGNNAEAISHYQEALQRLVHVLSPEAENVRVHLRKLGK